MAQLPCSEGLRAWGLLVGLGVVQRLGSMSGLQRPAGGIPVCGFGMTAATLLSLEVLVELPGGGGLALGHPKQSPSASVHGG